MPDYAVNTIFGAKDRITSAFTKMGKGAKDFGNRADKAFRKASTSGATLGTVIKGILGANILRRGFYYLQQGFQNFVDQTKMLEDATARFQPLMGSVERSRQLVDALNETAATTPYQFEGISEIASLLLPNMNKDIGKTIETFRMLGDTAGGNMERLTSITSAYAKALNKGKVDMKVLNQLATAGLPVFDYLADSMGVATSEIFELSKQGRLTADDLTAMFRKITSEGGDFYRGMEIASETLSGKLSTLSDNYNLTLAIVGEQFLPIVKEVVNSAINATKSIRDWVTANKELIKSGIDDFIKTVKNIIDSIGPPLGRFIDSVFKLGGVILDLAMSILPPAAKETFNFENAVNAVAEIIDFVSTVIGYFAQGIKYLKPILVPVLAALASWIALQWALNVALSANPIGLIIVGIGLLVAAIGWLGENWQMVVDGFMAGIDAIVGFFRSAADIIIGVFKTVWDFIMGVIDVVRGVIDELSGDAQIQRMLDIAVEKGRMTEEEARSKGWKGDNNESMPPNYEEAQARVLGFQGTLNINGAPQGSTFKQDKKSQNYIDVNMLGANP